MADDFWQNVLYWLLLFIIVPVFNRLGEDVAAHYSKIMITKIRERIKPKTITVGRTFTAVYNILPPYQLTLDDLYDFSESCRAGGADWRDYYHPYKSPFGVNVANVD